MRQIATIPTGLGVGALLRSVYAQKFAGCSEFQGNFRCIPQGIIVASSAVSSQTAAEKIAAGNINNLGLVEAMPWVKGQSGNPLGRRSVPPIERMWASRLKTAAHRKMEIGTDGKPMPLLREPGDKVDRLTVAADKVMELACDGNAWAIEHIANRFDGKVREQVDVNYSANVKVRYESYQEVRAALLAEGINVDRLPLLTTLRPPEGQERD
jgi:hypothetical protein